MPLITTKQHDHILWTTLNRPKTRNAINFEVMDALEEILTQLESDPNIRVFILSGADSRSFISGGDLREFHKLKSADEASTMARRMLSILKRIEHLPCWSIACVNGAAYGGGCETMLAFDFRVAADSATFGFTQGKFYLPPGWGGLTRLVERVGRPTALKWLAEAAVVDSRTALAKGLVDEVFPAAQLVEETWGMANRMTKNDRDYIAALKKGAFRFSELRWDAIEAELQPFSRFWADKRHRQRVEKFLDKDDSGENQSVV